jgi:hypothetical protein
MSKYTVAKARGKWWVIDDEGFEVSYVGHDFKYEALAAVKIQEADDRMAKRNADHVDGYDRDDLGESPDF